MFENFSSLFFWTDSTYIYWKFFSDFHRSLFLLLLMKSDSTQKMGFLLPKINPKNGLNSNLTRYFINFPHHLFDDFSKSCLVWKIIIKFWKFKKKFKKPLLLSPERKCIYVYFFWQILPFLYVELRTIRLLEHKKIPKNPIENGIKNTEIVTY